MTINSHLQQSVVLALYCSGLTWEDSTSTVIRIVRAILGDSGQSLRLELTHEAERAAMLGAIMARKVAMGPNDVPFKDPEAIFVRLMSQPNHLLTLIYAQAVESRTPPLLISLR